MGGIGAGCAAPADRCIAEGVYTRIQSQRQPIAGRGSAHSAAQADRTACCRIQGQITADADGSRRSCGPGFRCREIDDTRSRRDELIVRNNNRRRVCGIACQIECTAGGGDNTIGVKIESARGCIA